MSIKLNVDEIIKLDTIKYKRLSSNDCEDEETGGQQSLLDDDEKNLTLLDEDDLTLLHGDDFSWFRRSVHLLIFFIGVAALLLIAIMVLPKRFGTVNFENGFGVRLDLKRIEAGRQGITKRLEDRLDVTKKWLPIDYKTKEEEIVSPNRSWLKSTVVHPKIVKVNKNETKSDENKKISTISHQNSTNLNKKLTSKSPILTSNSTKCPLENRQNSTQRLEPSINQKLPKPNKPKYIAPNETKNLQCSQFYQLNGNFKDYKSHKVRYKDPTDESKLPMDCKFIKLRSYFQTENLYPEETEFPIAFARSVYTDYRFLEMELAASYAPQNLYCYAIDSKAPPLFHKRMQSLVNCFPNVYLTLREFHMDSSGHNMGYSHYECMKLLAKQELKWKYMVLLQNHDVALKTNQELVQIYKWFNGTNDISAKFVPWDRINKKSNWTFEAMHLFKNETRNIMPHKGFKPQMRFAKSLVQVSVSREMIDFMLNELDMTLIMKNIDWSAYGIDEILMGSLNAADAIEAPGGYTEYCLDHKKIESSLTRLTYWNGHACKSGMWRHSICILGMEHLIELSQTYYLFGNKFMPDRDFGSIACWHELIFNRTHLDRGIHRLNSEVYLNLPHVRYNREKKQLGDKFDPAQFNCTSEVMGR